MSLPRHRLDSRLSDGDAAAAVRGRDVKQRILRPIIPFADRMKPKLVIPCGSAGQSPTRLRSTSGADLEESHLLVDANHAVKKLM